MKSNKVDVELTISDHDASKSHGNRHLAADSGNNSLRQGLGHTRILRNDSSGWEEIIFNMARQRYAMANRQELTGFVFLLIAAFSLRLIVMIFYIDIPGDGPSRAIIAYNWSRSPYISTHGNWLPGFMYLAGIFSFIVNDPFFSARILNLVIGTLTIPLFYLLARRVYGSPAALFSGSILAFLPLHIGLSASSLIEASLLFEIIAGMVLLIRASESTKGQRLYLGLALVCLCLAVMTRYEAWLFIPLFASYYLLKTKKASTAILMIVVLLIFPVGWMLENYYHTGDFLPAFSSTTKMGPEAVGAQAVDLFSAIKVIARKFVSHLGWVLFIAAIWGGILQVIQASKAKVDLERVLYLSLTCVFWVFMVYFTTTRGRSLWDRFLLFGFVMALPFGLLPFMNNFSNYKRWLGLIICLALASVGVSKFSYRPQMYVTQKQPTEIKQVAAWLQKGPYRNDAILATKMDWQSSYLPLYIPEMSSRYLIVSFWTKDSTLQDFLKNQQPSLLMTRDGDDEFVARVEALLGRTILPAQLVHTEGTIKVYALKG